MDTTSDTRSSELVQASLVLSQDDWELVMRTLRKEYRGEVIQHYENPTAKALALYDALSQLDVIAEATTTHSAVTEWRVTP